MSRGSHREHDGEHGRRQAESLDEATNRGFWREYRKVMTERAAK